MSTATEMAALRAIPDTLAAEYVDLCHELGCIVKPGTALKFAKDLRRRLGEQNQREVDLIRMWDHASPTERQELDRFRRGWGPSSPTERERRRGDVAACIQALSIAMSDLSPNENEDLDEQARDRLDEAYDRVDKAHAAALTILQEIATDPKEWPDIVAAEERGQARAFASAWSFDMTAAPRDGSKIDLLFPYPRGRTIDCFWGRSELFGGHTWIWRRPTWDRERPCDLLSEDRWQTSCYPNLQPLAWRWPDVPTLSPNHATLETEEPTDAAR